MSAPVATSTLEPTVQPFNGHRWLLAVDASNAAKKAFDLCIQMLSMTNAMPKDYKLELHVIHVSDPEDEKHLNVIHRTEHVISNYENFCMEARRKVPKLATFAKSLAKKGVTTKERILDYAEEIDATFVVVGFAGISQEKYSSRTGDLHREESLGSFADLLVRSSRVTTVVAKSWSPVVSNPKDFVIVVPVDGSGPSEKAFSVAVHLWSSLGDTVPENFKVIHLSRHYGDNDKKIIARYEALLKERGVKGVVKYVARNVEKNVGEDICNYARSADADFICIGSVGLSGPKPDERLGSVADYVVRHSRCHNIVAKASTHL